MRIIKIVTPVILLFLFPVSLLADCRVLTPDESEYYGRQDLINIVFKILFIGIAIVFAGVGILRLSKFKSGKIMIALLAFGTLPLILGFLIAEAWTMECGFGGIGAQYYLIPLVLSVVGSMGVRQFADFPAGSRSGKI